MKHRFEYIFSGSGFLRFPNRKTIDANDDILKYYPQVFEWARKQNVLRNNYEFEFSLLCNAYTQKNEATNIKNALFHGADNFYLDSGGLQIITRGNKIDAEMKRKIYDVQMLGDFGFCFDEIPLVKNEVIQFKPKGKSKYLQNNSRATISDKIYVTSNKKSSGIETGKNIQHQISAFKDKGTNTKSIIILQGNQTLDMVDFFYDVLSQIDSKDYDYIGGIALADTCMGNGILETCDMMAAWRKLYEETDLHFVKDHVHLLGVGSLYRFVPYLCMSKSGFVPQTTKISADSTSHSIAYHVGFYKGADFVRYENMRSPVNEMLFGRVYDEFEFIISDFFTKEQYIDYFCDRIHSFALQRSDAEDERMAHFANLNVFLHAMSALNDMLIGFDNFDIIESKKYSGALEALHQVKTYDDYVDWRKAAGKYVPSKRIMRRETAKQTTLEDFF